MTPGNLKLQVQAEVERGDAALTAAETLLEAGLNYDAASRAYYAAFHFARALALAAICEPRRLGAAICLEIGLFDRHLSQGTNRLGRLWLS